MTKTEISRADDVIDIRDVIEVIEGLEDADETSEELTILKALMDDLKGYGGDEQWRGDWYPIALIRDSHWVDYARELLEDIGTIPKDFPSFVAIDWNETASNIQVDYSSVEFEGVTYWYR
jgi:hypothetical protein